jgi:hypothetical protein
MKGLPVDQQHPVSYPVMKRACYARTTEKGSRQNSNTCTHNLDNKEHNQHRPLPTPLSQHPAHSNGTREIIY